MKSELGSYHRPPEMNRIAMPTEAAIEEMLAGFERDEYEIAVGEAANSRAKREAMFDVMNARR